MSREQWIVLGWVKLPPVRLVESTTPVKAKTSMQRPTPLAPSTPCRCMALTRRGHGEATRTGSRGRGGGLRQTLDRPVSRSSPLTVSRRDEAGTAWATPLES
jgi:hypothetical protein